MINISEKKCAQCGNRFSVRKAEVKRGGGVFCSRSCAVIRNNRARRWGRTFLSYKEKKQKYKRLFLFGCKVSRIRGRARESGIPCDLTSPMFAEMWKAQGGRCGYTGRKMTLGRSTRLHTDMDQATVDQIMPGKGYVRGNMILCCYWMNCAKGQGTLRKLIIRVKELLKKRG